MNKTREIILTGDRPTGKLHLGHYVGSLKNRVILQDEYDTFIIIADFQVLIDHLKDSHQVEANIKEIVLDYLAVGIDPAKSTIFIQSAVPQLAELTMYLSMLVTVARLRRNPTVKAEAQRVGVDSEQDNIIYGFLGYPVSQAADILLFRAHCVPAGEDQRPHIEQTRELAERFNKLFNEVFPIPELLVSEMPKLPGLSGEGKMSKSLGNAIYLSDPADLVRQKVMSMYTDPTRQRATDPGHIEGNVVFTYLDAFDSNVEHVAGLKEKYQAGGIGDAELKQYLFEVLMRFLEPIQKRRAEFEQQPDYIRQVVSQGCTRAREVGEETMKLVRRAVQYDYPNLLGPLEWGKEVSEMLGLLNLQKIGQRLARVDRHLLQTLAVRIGASSLSDAVAECKRKQEGPLPELTRKEVEDQRIAQAATWAERLGVDPDYAAAIFYGVISESCRTQMNFLHRHFKDQESGIEDDPEAAWRFYREELLRLTKAVAPYYDEGYAREFFGTKVYLRFERGELGRLIADLEDHQLALDLGCATGTKSVVLSESFKRVAGYDISPDMIEKANARLERENGNAERITFEVADLEEGIPQDDASVSLVLMNLGTGSDIRNVDKLLVETHRVLRPGGAFLFSFYNVGSLLAMLGFLPWPTSLAAMVDPDKRCLEVHFGKEVFLIYARPYTVDEVKRLFVASKLTVRDIFTYPTISAILPEDILTTETFKSYGDLVEARRYHRAVMEVDNNQLARNALMRVDEELARSPQHLGVYILVTGVK